MPPFDPSRLTEEERELWGRFFSRPSQESPAVRVWGFAYACTLGLDGTPEVVREWLRENDPQAHVPRYWRNASEARREGRL